MIYFRERRMKGLHDSRHYTEDKTQITHQNHKSSIPKQSQMSASRTYNPFFAC